MKHFLLPFCMLCFVISCTKPDTIVLSLSGDIEVPAEGKEYPITISASSDWTSSVSSSTPLSWFSISPSKGSQADQKAIISIPQNTKGEERSAIIVFKCGDAQASINIKQKKNSITLSPSEDIVVPSGGGEYSITVDSPLEWTSSVSYSTQEKWCTVSPSKGSQNSKTAVISVSENSSGDDRSATIVFSSGELQESINIKQVQNDVLLISQDTYEIKAEGGIIKVKVTNNVDFGWEIESAASDWISDMSTKAVTDSYISFNIEQNPTLESREGHITFKYGTISQVITVIQKGVVPYIRLSNNYFTFGTDGGEAHVSVTSNFDYDITIPTYMSDWVSLSTSDNNSSTHIFSVSVNDGPDNRAGNVVFSIKDYKVEMSISQSGDPRFELLENPHSDSGEGGTYSIKYAGNFKCYVDTYYDWVKVKQHEFKDNIGVITIEVEKNDTGKSRSCGISLIGYNTGITFWINQEVPIEIVSITNITAGSLKTLIGSSQRYSITGFKISGPLNSDDIALIRDMAGDNGKNLRYLDLSDATIVSGGSSYWTEYYYYHGLKEDKNHKFRSKDNTITSYMFSKCWRIKTIILPKSVTTIEEDAFFYFDNYESITLPDNIESINSVFTSSYCNEIVLSSDNQYYTVVDGILFSKDLKKLISCPAKNPKVQTKYTIPASVEVIGQEAFHSCRNLTDIVVPKTVKRIENYAFIRCNLDSITIYPTTAYGFLGANTNFKNVYIPKEYDTFDANIFVSGNFDARGHCTIDNLWVACVTPPIIDQWHQFNSDIEQKTNLYVPKGSLTQYKLAFCWGDFTNIKEY